MKISFWDYLWLKNNAQSFVSNLCTSFLAVLSLTFLFQWVDHPHGGAGQQNLEDHHHQGCCGVGSMIARFTRHCAAEKGEKSSGRWSAEWQQLNHEKQPCLGCVQLLLVQPRSDSRNVKAKTMAPLCPQHVHQRPFICVSVCLSVVSNVYRCMCSDEYPYHIPNPYTTLIHQGLYRYPTQDKYQVSWGAEQNYTALATTL